MDEHKIEKGAAEGDSLDAPELIIITGMSGAGRTEAMHIFEDLGYFCIDNLPPKLLHTLVKSENLPSGTESAQKLAVVCDARNNEYLHELQDELDQIRALGYRCWIIFLDSSDETLLARYKASRRRHPLCTDNKMTIAQGIARERSMLSELREAANVLVDTTELRPIELRAILRESFSNQELQLGLGVVVYSFGFKHGAATDADIVIDVRFLPNPFYDPELRHLTGLDDPIRDFVMQRPETAAFMEKWKELLLCIMPGYVSEGKQHIAIGVGCTGGQHRSVTLAEETGAFLREAGYRVHVNHRDLSRADTTPSEGTDGGDAR